MPNEPINEDKINQEPTPLGEGDEIDQKASEERGHYISEPMQVDGGTITIEFPNYKINKEDYVEIDLDDIKELEFTLPEPGNPNLGNQGSNNIEITQPSSVVPGDSRAILSGRLDPGFSNNVEARQTPTLATPSEAKALLQQDPFNNPNPPVIASNSQFAQNVRPTSLANTAIQNNIPVTNDQPGVTIGNTSDFLRSQAGGFTGNNNNVQNANTGQGVDNRTIFNTLDPETGLPIGAPGTDDSTAAGTGDGVADNQAEVGRLWGDITGTGPGTDKGTGARNQRGTGQRTTDNTAPELSADWRFRIGLLPGSVDLYKSGDAGILAPLIATNGVIFPYTPSIQMTYMADYQSTAPTHSNFPSRFYSSSEVRDVQINGTFTAQSTNEADYMMAAIHFFRSATKMFYGQDANAGQPPPLVQCTGLGPHQFNGHKAVIQQFNYTLPENVDYVRTSAGGVTTKSVNQIRARRESGADQFGIFGMAGRIGRLLGIGANRGAMPNTLTQQSATSSLAKAGASYVPTKMEFSLVLLPVVSRAEQTGSYSTLGYANGENYKNRGHW